MPRRGAPQEKKLIAHTGDRRNRYGENDRSSRRNIARSEWLVERANRRRACGVLAGVRGVVDAEEGRGADIERSRRLRERMRRPGR